MADSRDLNFEVVDQLIEAGVEPRSLLEDLIRAMDSNEVNDNLAFIVRVSDYSGLLDPETDKELDTYERN
tara:strand:- start:86 stop:295 length:210 start_codon:yes stop_codon:yes gene_type:complete